MLSTNKEPTRWNIAMTALLYPAIFGALIYEGFGKLLALSEKPSTCSCAAVLLVFALFVLYIFDFVYTWVDKEKYDGRNFLCDLSIVVFLYFSIKVAFFPLPKDGSIFDLKSTLPEYYHSPAIWLFFTKLASVLWEFFEQDKDKPAPKKFDINTDLACGIAYIYIFLLSGVPSLMSPTVSTLILVAIVLLDIWWYYEDITQRDEICQDEEIHHMVETRAYLIAEQHGFQGRPEEHWVAAERETGPLLHLFRRI